MKNALNCYFLNRKIKFRILMSGFYSSRNLSRNFAHNWLEALFDTVKSPFEFSLSLLC